MITSTNIDFTLKTYENLIVALLNHNYLFQTFEEYISNPLSKSVILRHDIDLKKRSSLVFASLENNLKIKATYYFRAVKRIFDPLIIKQVANYGHEIGYHYEDLSEAKGNYSKAYQMFNENLLRFREIYPVTTICMHGRSLSRYDNKLLWKNKDYRQFGIKGEPYFDIDFNKVLYLTDSAQRWNGSNISIRDKVNTSLDYNFKTTFDIIDNVNVLPNQIMITVHPDRWTDNWLEWQRIDKAVKCKNLIKKYILSKR